MPSFPLQHGQSSDDIATVNTRLGVLGLPHSVGRLFGWNTVRGVCTVQQRYGRVPTGSVDSTTWDDINTGTKDFDGVLLYEDAPQTGTGPAAYAED